MCPEFLPMCEPPRFSISSDLEVQQRSSTYYIGFVAPAPTWLQRHSLVMPDYNLEEDCALFKLPRELREYVYELAFTSGNPLRFARDHRSFHLKPETVTTLQAEGQSSSPNSIVPSSLLRTCHVINQEAFSAMFRVATFRVKCQPHVPRKEAFRSAIGLHLFHLLRNISLHMPMDSKIRGHKPHVKHFKSFGEIRNGQTFNIRFCCIGCGQRKMIRPCGYVIHEMPTYLLEIFGEALAGFKEVIFSTNLEHKGPGWHAGRCDGRHVEGSNGHHELMAELTATLGRYLGDCVLTEDPEGIDVLDRLVYHPQQR